jgi:hypothetical protein
MIPNLDKQIIFANKFGYSSNRPVKLTKRFSQAFDKLLWRFKSILTQWKRIQSPMFSAWEWFNEIDS